MTKQEDASSSKQKQTAVLTVPNTNELTKGANMGLLSGLIGGAMDLIGGSKDRKAAKRENDRQYDLARNSIKYRTEDAKNAGIHPLYAMGAPTLSSSFTTTKSQIGNAGEKIARGISSNYEKELQSKNLQNISADIELKKAQTMGFIQDAKDASNLARANQTGRTAGNPNSLKVAGSDIAPSKNWSDTQKIEDRYGDLISWMYGVGVLGADGLKKMESKQTPRKKPKPRSKSKYANPYLSGKKQQEYIQFMQNQQK